MMYWAENGGVGVQPGIMKANMDGTGIQSLVTTNLGHIDFITIDLEQHMLYWSESTNQVVSTECHSIVLSCLCLFDVVL